MHTFNLKRRKINWQLKCEQLQVLLSLKDNTLFSVIFVGP